jgi:hypothetical protein
MARRPQTTPKTGDPNQAESAPDSLSDETALEQLADREFENGAGIPLEEAIAWVESWFTPNERPAPKARKLD